jgi:hypothetical protein
MQAEIIIFTFFPELLTIVLMLLAFLPLFPFHESVFTFFFQNILNINSDPGQIDKIVFAQMYISNGKTTRNNLL